MKCRLVLLMALAVAAGARAQTPPPDALLDALVWGTHVPIDPGWFEGELRTDLEAYLRRAAGYRSMRVPLSAEPIAVSVYIKQVSYERRLAALSDDPEAADLAREYVDNLPLCYEWEGFHDCPEREALFADEYQAAHPGGPFSEYLPVLSAHRWLCAAEAFGRQQQPEEEARSRRLYGERITAALRSRSLLMRSAAIQLSTRSAC